MPVGLPLEWWGQFDPRGLELPGRGQREVEKTRKRAQKDPKNVEISSNERLIMEK
ncbi:hypothetical protein PISMIDRAFT_686763 [Pisolithus microcarpus 441]|uniref:Uncharacterized protein n=1 Tax=Pisolithus microcarpus 441 TaxID=765257 RepID=A0A0C9Z3P0_9AGAM|nr:hypothetical protein PISMIDRAFT_687767 [Pisolithus microcarpus 441]KIK15997.1 hypothetical protein PISMIDRAFT_686763 [Pisolithus microcarpus 441]